MLGLHKRPLEPLGPREALQRQYYANLAAQPERSPREFERTHVFVGENNLKRNYHEFRQDEHTQQLLALQLQHPRTRPTGELWTPPKNPEDPDTSMTDAPPVRHVHYTPPVGWKPATTNGTANPPGSILKRRMHPYDSLPYDRNNIQSPFEYDYSGYIEETERRDAETAQPERGERERQETTKGQQQRSFSHSSKPQLGFADLRGHTRRPASRSRFSELQPSLLAARSEQPSPPPPLRKILTPTSPKRSPQYPPPLPRPAAIDLYPQLAATSTAGTVVEEPAALRRFGGMFVGIVQSVQQFFVWGYNTLVRRQSIPKQEIYVVETDQTGRKRRAVAAVDLENNTQSPPETTMMAFMPGDFSGGDEELKNESPKKQTHTSKQEATPPTSRPGSSESNQSNVSNEPVSLEQSTAIQSSRHALGQQSVPLPEQTSEVRPTFGSYKSSRHRAELHLTDKEKLLEAQLEQVRQKQRLQTGGPQYGQGPRVPKVNPLPPDARRPVTDLKKYNKARDDGLEVLLAKTSRITLQSREHTQTLRDSKLRKEREAYEQQDELAKDEPSFKEQARLEVERETVEFKKKAEQEAKEEAERQAAQEAQAKAEEARMKAEEAEKNRLIRELPREWAVKVDAAMSNSKANPRKILAKAADGADLTAYDLGRIIPSGEAGSGTTWWMNDEGVNAVFHALVAASKEKTGWKKPSPKAPEIVAYNSAWLNTYKVKGTEGIKGWSRRMGLQGKLFTAKLVLFPINTGAHWLLLTIRPQERKIEILDSAGTGHRRFFEIAREWLQMELGKEYIADEWTEVVGRSQQQLNADDCGVFTCMNALAAAKNREPAEVTPSNGMMNARRMIVAILLNGGFTGDWQL